MRLFDERNRYQENVLKHSRSKSTILGAFKPSYLAAPFVLVTPFAGAYLFMSLHHPAKADVSQAQTSVSVTASSSSQSSPSPTPASESTNQSTSLTQSSSNGQSHVSLTVNGEPIDVPQN